MSDDREVIENRTHALEASPAQFTLEHFCLALGLLQELGAPFHISVDEGVLDNFIEVIVRKVVVRRFPSFSARQGRENVDVLGPAVVAVVVHRPFPFHAVDSRKKKAKSGFRSRIQRRTASDASLPKLRRVPTSTGSSSKCHGINASPLLPLPHHHTTLPSTRSHELHHPVRQPHLPISVSGLLGCRRPVPVEGRLRPAGIVPVRGDNLEDWRNLHNYMVCPLRSLKPSVVTG